jgi:phage shock protein C
MRSTRERMWAGVAGGLGEYFEIDPTLVRLLWVAATVVSGGLAVGVYIILWIILPRDDRTIGAAPTHWRDWSEEFHSEAQRLAEEARHVSHTWRAPSQTEPPAENPWWQSERYTDQPHPRHHHTKSTGVVLVVLGVLLLAANAGIFNWVQWRTMWPLIFIGLGVILLGRQSGWWSR